MTREYFISTFGREPDAVEEKWLRFISPLKVKVGNKLMTVPFCQAFCYTESDRRLYPIPLEVQILIYGEEVPGLDLQQFSAEAFEFGRRFSDKCFLGGVFKGLDSEKPFGDRGPEFVPDIAQQLLPRCDEVLKVLGHRVVGLGQLGDLVAACDFGTALVLPF